MPYDGHERHSGDLWPRHDARLRLRGRIGILAVHAGLENGTRELAEAVARRTNSSLLTFTQYERPRVHITSRLFAPDRLPQLAAFLDRVDLVVSLHGHSWAEEWSESIFVGGQNRGAASVVGAALRAHAPHFDVHDELEAIPELLRGVHPMNPPNLADRGGVQVELSCSARGAVLGSEAGIATTPPPRIIDALAEGVNALSRSLAQPAQTYEPSLV